MKNFVCAFVTALALTGGQLGSARPGVGMISPVPPALRPSQETRLRLPSIPRTNVLARLTERNTLRLSRSARSDAFRRGQPFASSTPDCPVIKMDDLLGSKELVEEILLLSVHPDLLPQVLLHLQFGDFLPEWVPDSTWMWANSNARSDPSARFVSATGTVVAVGDTDPVTSERTRAEKARVNFEDFSPGHDSHDFMADIRLDPGQDQLLSLSGKDLFQPFGTMEMLTDGSTKRFGQPDTLHVEWETGIKPNEGRGDGAQPTFPKWAWPTIGDRLWVNGHWIYDCGHPRVKVQDNSRNYPTEIHPIRAIASMRDQWHRLPGSGALPVRVTATDLYIHGQSGFVTEVLECGSGVMISTQAKSCDPLPHPHRGTPIADNFDFDVPLPPKPFAHAVLAVLVEPGPANSVGIAPQLDARPGATDPVFPHGRMHVSVRLREASVSPQDVYARRIYVGWVFPPEGLRHLRLTINKMDLHNDRDASADGELTFFWVNLDRAGDEWRRLSDFEEETCAERDLGVCIFNNTMGGYDDDEDRDAEHTFHDGNGLVDFRDLTYDFFVGDGVPFTIRATGFESDCWYQDFVGNHGALLVDPGLPFQVPALVSCLASTPDTESTELLACLALGGGPACFLLFSEALSIRELSFQAQNDDYQYLEASFRPDSNYGIGSHRIGSGAGHDDEYHLELQIDELPVFEDPADLELTKQCDSQPRSGRAFTCSILVANNGPGLPRNVVVTDVLISPNIEPAHYTMSSPTFIIGGGIVTATGTCPITSPGQFSCNLGTIPEGTAALITVQITPDRGGNFFQVAEVTTTSSDPNTENNRARADVEVIQVVQIDIRPGDPTNPVSVRPTRGGRIPVAVLSSAEFDAFNRIDQSSLTFGPIGNEPSLLSCANRAEDVNKDGRGDLVCHFSDDPRLFNLSSVQGLLRGRTHDGLAIEGVDRVRPVP